MISLIKQLDKILPRSDRWKVGVLLVLMLIAGALEVAGISMILTFVSIVSEPHRLQETQILSTVIQYLGIETQRDLLIYGSVALIGIFLIKNVYLIALDYVKNIFTYNRFRYISSKLFQRYMYAPYTFHLQRNTAELIRNISGEALIVSSGVITSILDITTQCIIAAGIIMFLLTVEPLVTIVILGILGGSSAIFLKFLKQRTQRHGTKSLKARANMIQILNEGLGGFKDATITHRQSWFVQRFVTSTRVVARAEVFKHVAKRGTDRFIEIVLMSSILFITLMLVLQGKEIASAIPIIALFGAAAIRLMPAFSMVTGSYNSLRYYAHSLNSVHADIKTILPPMKSTRLQPAPFTFKDSIALDKISYAYPDSREVAIQDVSAIINKGAAIGIVGSSGSGKTTLVDIILGLLNPVNGQILVDGVNIKTNLHGWQESIGYIPQSIYLADNTIRNNIAFGLNNDVINEDQVQNAVQMAQLDEVVQKLPDGLDTMIGERGIRLSGGQRQRIGIARALYHNPELLIMDEATASLDNRTEQYVMKAIEQLKGKQTIILIAHRLTTVRDCDILHVMKAGEIISSGSYENLLASSKEFQSLAHSS